MSNYKEGGYDKKYIISKANGNPVDPKAEYFVFRLDKDPYALDALYMYACSLVYVNEQLSNELIEIVDFYKEDQLVHGIKKENHRTVVRKYYDSKRGEGK